MSTPGAVTALRVAYDGTDFAGWQIQPGVETIQGVLERALARVHGVATTRVPVVGSGRTDAGVHALGQVASYRPPTPREPAVLEHALNGLLPKAIRVLAVGAMPSTFHACRSATGKIYRYRIVNRSLALPFEVRHAWHVRAPLDRGAMAEAATALVGQHDFASFASTGGQNKDSVRHLRVLELRTRDAGIIEIEAEADGFLYHMVRNVVGLLVEIGSGRRAVNDARHLLEARTRASSAPGAPAEGLCLVRVMYDPDLGF